MKFSNRRVFFVFIDKTSYSFIVVVCRSLFVHSHWFSRRNEVYCKSLVYRHDLSIQTLCLSATFPQKQNTAYVHSRKWDVLIKNGQINSRKIVPRARDQTTHSVQLHSISLSWLEIFLCSLLLLHCASFVLLTLLFSFFLLMTFSVSTVHFSKFILFGGKQIILHLT